MARYGTFAYTTGTLYGPSGTTPFRAPFFKAEARGYNALNLRWGNPEGAWMRVRLVRSQYGFPAYASDGQTLLESNSGSAAVGVKDPVVTTYDDTNLTPGKTYYYSLFVRVASGPLLQWFRAGDAIGQSVTDHGYSDLLLNRLPTVYTNVDEQVDGQPSPNTTLSRYLSLFGFDLCRFRDTLDALHFINDPNDVPGPLLPSMGAQLGFGYEPEIGMRQNRVLFRNAMFLRQRKGTTSGLSGLISSVTGYGANIEPLHNLLLSPDDSSADGSVGDWVASGLTLTRNATVLGPTIDGTDDVKTGVFQVAAGSGSLALGLATPVDNGVPIQPDNLYAISAWVKREASSTSGTAQFRVSFFDQSGVLLGSAITGTSHTLTTSWDQTSLIVQSPSKAAFLAVEILVTVVGGAAYLDACQLELIRNLATHPVAPDASTYVRTTTDQSVTSGSTDGAVSGGYTRVTTDAGVSPEVARFIFNTSGTPIPTARSYYGSLYVRPSRTQKFELRNLLADATTSSGATGVTCPAGVWTRLFCTWTESTDSAKECTTLQVHSTEAAVVGDYVDVSNGAVEYNTLTVWQDNTPTPYETARKVTCTLVAPRIQECLNPSFDDDLGGWTNLSVDTWAGSVARVTTVARELGYASAEVTTTAVGTFAYRTSVTVDAAKAFAASAYFLLDSGAPLDVSMQVDWYSRAQELVGHSFVQPTAVTATDWTRVGGPMRSPATATTAVFTILIPMTGTSQKVYIDDVLLEHNSIVDEYFDKRTDWENTFLENGLNVGPSRVHYYPLFPYRYARALDLAQNSVALGTEVSFAFARPRQDNWLAEISTAFNENFTAGF